MCSRVGLNFFKCRNLIKFMADSHHRVSLIFLARQRSTAPEFQDTSTQRHTSCGAESGQCLYDFNDGMLLSFERERVFTRPCHLHFEFATRKQRGIFFPPWFPKKKIFYSKLNFQIRLFGINGLKKANHVIIKYFGGTLKISKLKWKFRKSAKINYRLPPLNLCG